VVNTLENQTVIILGGTSGIGYGVAKNIIESTRAKVIIASSNENKVEQAVTS
jgi:short-subunit dehydrogenase involved in D-alanine esterification of teichoic acids